MHTLSQTQIGCRCPSEINEKWESGVGEDCKDREDSGHNRQSEEIIDVYLEHVTLHWDNNRFINALNGQQKNK